MVVVRLGVTDLPDMVVCKKSSGKIFLSRNFRRKIEDTFWILLVYNNHVLNDGVQSRDIISEKKTKISFYYRLLKHEVVVEFVIELVIE